MAYLPYRMYGNGNFPLPIIDIVQTINSNSQACKNSTVSRSIIGSSSQGFFNLKNELSRRTEKQLRTFRERKSISYNYLPKKTVSQLEEKTNNEQSRTKIIKIRKVAPQNGNRVFGCNCARDGEGLGENKSLKVLFRARKTSSIFDNDGLEEEEFDSSFLKGSVISSVNLKRKGSFADFIRVKRRKRNES